MCTLLYGFMPDGRFVEIANFHGRKISLSDAIIARALDGDEKLSVLSQIADGQCDSEIFRSRHPNAPIPENVKTIAEVDPEHLTRGMLLGLIRSLLGKELITLGSLSDADILDMAKALMARESLQLILADQKQTRPDS